MEKWILKILKCNLVQRHLKIRAFCKELLEKEILMNFDNLCNNTIY